MSSGLMNCPFCGSPAELERDSDHHGEWFNLGCSRHFDAVPDPDKSCPGGRIWYTEELDNEEAAITAWNTRAPSDAALVGALEEAEATLALCEHPRSEDRSYGPEVDELGRRIGFGALMSSAQASWRKYLHDKGNPLGGEFVAGPTFGTVTRTLGIIRSALAAAKGQP